MYLQKDSPHREEKTHEINNNNRVSLTLVNVQKSKMYDNEDKLQVNISSVNMLKGL